MVQIGIYKVSVRLALRRENDRQGRGRKYTKSPVEKQLRKEMRKPSEKLSEIRNMFMEYMEEMNVKIRKWENTIKDLKEKIEETIKRYEYENVYKVSVRLVFNLSNTPMQLERVKIALRCKRERCINVS